MSPLLCVSLFCGLLTAEMSSPLKRQSVCEDVMEEADRQGVEPLLAVAVAWRESALTRNAKSSAGAVGPMQVIPRFWCKSKPCDYIEAGVRALKYYTGRYGVQRGLCAYLTGKPCEYGGHTVSAYRSAVIMKASEFADLWSRVCDVEGC